MQKEHAVKALIIAGLVFVTKKSERIFIFYHEIFSLVKPLKVIGFCLGDLLNWSENL